MVHWFRRASRRCRLLPRLVRGFELTVASYTQESAHRGYTPWNMLGTIRLRRHLVSDACDRRAEWRVALLRFQLSR